MRTTALRALIMLGCVISVSCGGGSDSTGPGPSPVTSAGGGGDAGSDVVRNTSQITDSSFDDNDWEDVVETLNASGSGSGGHLRFNGQAGADYRQITISINSGGADGRLAVFAINRAQAYSPSSDGAVLWIDYSESSINQLSGTQYSAPAIRQNGKIYTLVPGGGAFATPEAAWTDHALTHLTQNDFRTLASATDHPDFSRNGSRIEIGFMRLQVGQGATKGGIDNYRLVLYRN